MLSLWIVSIIVYNLPVIIKVPPHNKSLKATTIDINAHHLIISESETSFGQLPGLVIGETNPQRSGQQDIMLHWHVLSNIINIQYVPLFFLRWRSGALYWIKLKTKILNKSQLLFERLKLSLKCHEFFKCTKIIFLIFLLHFVVDYGLWWG